MKATRALLAVNLALWPCASAAHVAEQAFVLLLPTGAYITAGVAAVAATVIALFAVPPSRIVALFAAREIDFPDFETGRTVTSLVALGAMWGAIYLGYSGPRDPLSNLLPLLFWTVGWIGLVSISGVFGNLWRWLNPWTGLYRVLGEPRPLLALPSYLGHWPSLLLLLGFALFLLVDISPDDPARLATAVGVYWAATMAGLVVFGPPWLERVELGQAIFGAFAKLTVLRGAKPSALGGPGWQVCEKAPPTGAGAFALGLLAVGSFDGINETFWWFAQIGVNPLEFPGRSAVIVENTLGLVGSIAVLFAVFAAIVRAGLWLAGGGTPAHAFAWMALTLLPIALVYHMAHYLTSFLVGIQYTLAALTDPFAAGADYLGIEPFYVTTGLFNRIDSVRLIWLTQAGLVVFGHIWSVLLSHRVALALQGDHRRAVRMTLPLSFFMIAYTFLGLWLLATPRGA